jgi:isoquinoline 1-oxidoreductase subunit beta
VFFHRLGEIRDRGEVPGGIEEAGATAGPPAFTNAIYAATGVRFRRLPIDRTQLSGNQKA